MGLISNLQSWVTKNVSSKTREKVVSAVDTALTVLTSPIAAVKNFKKAKEETSKKSALKLVSEGVENTLLAVAPFSSAGKSLAAKAVSTAFGSVKSSAITLTAAGAAIASPTVRETAIAAVTPSNYVGIGEKVGQFIEKSSPEVKDVASKAVVLGATGLGLVGTGVAAYNLLKSEDKTLETNSESMPTTSVNPSVSTNKQTPKTPETTVISSTKTTGRRRKYTKKRETPYINIKIDNREDNDTYDRKIYKGGRR